MENTDDRFVLNSIYRGAKTGSQAISDLLPQVRDQKFIADLNTQNGDYASIASAAAEKLCALGGTPEEVPMMKKAGMKMGVMMNTALDDTTSHMAELMIKGSSMGITQMTKVLNDYQPPRKEVTELANRLITAEQNNIDRLKAYL